MRNEEPREARAPFERSLEPEFEPAPYDISDLKRIEEALRESEAFKNAIFDSVASHIAVLDRNGVIVAVNAPWRQFACENSAGAGGPPADTGIGVNYLAVCRRSFGESAEGAMTVNDGIRAVLEGRMASFTFEYPCHSPDEQRWFFLMVTPLGQGGRGAVVAHSNITGYKRVELALRESEEKYRTLFETMAQGVVYQDADGRIAAANPAAQRILGLALDQMQGCTSIDSRWRAIHECQATPKIDPLATPKIDPPVNWVIGLKGPRPA